MYFYSYLYDHFQRLKELKIFRTADENAIKGGAYSRIITFSEFNDKYDWLNATEEEGFKNVVTRLATERTITYY